MILLVVDDKKLWMERLADSLKKLFEKATVLYYSDPLLAGKYAFFNPVDAAFCALNMRRMNGMQLEKMIHYANTQSKVFLTGEKEEFEETDILDAHGRSVEPGIDGVLYYPLQEEEILALMQTGDPLQTPSKKEKETVKRTSEEVYDMLLQDDNLKQELVRAAMDDRLESFFRDLGCDADMEEIQLYFQKRILQKMTLSEEQLEEVQGGASPQQNFRKLILTWIS